MKKKAIHYLIIYIMLPLAWCYLRFVQASSKLVVHGDEVIDQLKQNDQAALFAFWHNRQILIPLLRPKDNIYGLISPSRDGDYMARYAKMFGKPSIRGSSSKKGATAMKKIISLLKQGTFIGIATDGPKGPAFKVKSGIVQLSQNLQVPIIPVSFEANKKKVLRSWDQSYILYPFSKIVAVIGEPITISGEHSIHQGCEMIETALNQTGKKAQELIQSM